MTATKHEFAVLPLVEFGRGAILVSLLPSGADGGGWA